MSTLEAEGTRPEEPYLPKDLEKCANTLALELQEKLMSCEEFTHLLSHDYAAPIFFGNADNETLANEEFSFRRGSWDYIFPFPRYLKDASGKTVLHYVTIRRTNRSTGITEMVALTPHTPIGSEIQFYSHPKNIFFVSPTRNNSIAEEKIRQFIESI